jgi:hypothetical protein
MSTTIPSTSLSKMITRSMSSQGSSLPSPPPSTSLGGLGTIEEEDPENPRLGAGEEEDRGIPFEGTEAEKIQLMWEQMTKMMKEAKESQRKIKELEKENTMLDIALSDLQGRGKTVPPPPQKKTIVIPSPSPQPTTSL